MRSRYQIRPEVATVVARFGLRTRHREKGTEKGAEQTIAKKGQSEIRVRKKRLVQAR